MDFQLLSATERDEIVASHLREHLPSLGLTEITPRRWIDGSQPPVRRLFELHLLKGAGIKVCWGFSLDFVPHISGGCVRWHRSDKTALLDLMIDPKDLPQLTYIYGSAHLADGLRGLLPQAISRAQVSWRRGANFHGMLDIIREIRGRHTNCFGYCNYTQLPLTYSLLSAKIGDLKTAESELDQYIIKHKLDDDEAAKLKKLARDYV